MFKVRKCVFQDCKEFIFGIKLDFQAQKSNSKSYRMLKCYLGKHFPWYESYQWVHNEKCIQSGPPVTYFSGEGTKYCHFLRQIVLPDPQNLDFI